MDGDAATEGEAPRAVGDARDADAKTDSAPPPIDAKAKRHRRRGGLLPPPALDELIKQSPSPSKEDARQDDARAGTSDEAAATATTPSTTASRDAFEDARKKNAEEVSEAGPGGGSHKPCGAAEGEGSPAPATKTAARRTSSRAGGVSSKSAELLRSDVVLQTSSCVSEETVSDFEARVAEAVAKALEAKKPSAEAKGAEASASRRRETEKEAGSAGSVRAQNSAARANAKPNASGRVASRETDGFRREIEGLKKDLEKQKERCASFEAKFKAAARERAAATAEKADVEKALRRAEAKADAESKLSERRDKALEQKHERLATQLEERKNACVALEKETRRLTAMTSQAERERDEAVEARVAADAALEPLKVALKEALAETERARSEALNASEMAEASAKDAASARAEMRTLDAVREELEEARAEAAAATAARVERDRVVGAELRDAQRRLAEWCATSAETEEELERTKNELVLLQTRVETLETSEEDSRVKRATAETEAADARAARDKAERERDETAAALERSRREFDPDRLETISRALRDAEVHLAASREENAALAASFRETEGILEEAVGRAEEETGARHALELALAARASGEKERLAALNDELARERRSVEDLERRAVRAEDRLRETERQLAKARAEAAVGVALSAPPPGAGPFAPAAETTPRSNATTISASATQHDASSLHLELKARTRQTHKLQEVCAGLKRRFIEGGGSASAFELGRDVCEARYELKACEQKRLAERERAERLQRELEKTRRLLASSERNQTVLGSSRTGGLAARAVNVDVDGRHPRGEGKQTNGAFRGTTKRGAENAA